MFQKLCFILAKQKKEVTMMTRYLTLVLLLATPLMATAQSAEKTFSKSFNTENKAQVALELPGEVDLKVWNNAYIRIEITVGLASGNTALLNELANVGRYNLVSKTSDELLVISAPNLQKQVRIKGEVLKENLTYVVFVPEGLKVKLTETEVLTAAAKVGE
jgi:hypothetical protein